MMAARLILRTVQTRDVRDRNIDCFFAKVRETAGDSARISWFIMNLETQT